MRVVVLGTGTNVGKTYFTRCLAKGLVAALGGGVLALKPVESGVQPGESGDAGAIAEAAQHAALLSPWRFPAPISPHLAARQAGLELAVSELADWVTAAEAGAAPRITLIETAGGVFSPLAPGSTNLELARALEPALFVLVAPDALGVLHDVGACLRAMSRQPDAVVLCGARPADASTGSNAAELARLGVAQPLHALAAGAEDVAPVVSWLSARYSQMSG